MQLLCAYLTYSARNGPRDRLCAVVTSCAGPDRLGAGSPSTNYDPRTTSAPNRIRRLDDVRPYPGAARGSRTIGRVESCSPSAGILSREPSNNLERSGSTSELIMTMWEVICGL